MTLGPCRDCGQRVSSRARRCPSCGRRRPETLSIERLRWRYAYWPAIFVVLVAVMYAKGWG